MSNAANFAISGFRKSMANNAREMGKGGGGGGDCEPLSLMPLLNFSMKVNEAI